jgi:hypothetical protein
LALPPRRRVSVATRDSPGLAPSGCGAIPLALLGALWRARRKLRAGEVVPSLQARAPARQPIVGAFKAGRQLWPLALLLARAVLGGAAVAAESLDDYGVAGGGALRPAGCALLAAGMGLAIAMRAPYKVRRRTGCTRQDLSLPV